MADSIPRLGPRLGAVAPLLLILAGCATAAGPRTLSAVAAPVPLYAVPTPEATAPAAGSAALPPASAAQPEPDPARLVGLNRAALEHLLGRPGAVRQDDPAEVWQYRVADCVLDLFLYQEATGYHLLYLEARSAAAKDAPAGRCLSALLRTKRRLPTS